MPPIPMYMMIKEIYPVLDDLQADGFINDWDREFISDQMERVSKHDHLTAFSDKQAGHIHRIYDAACKSPH